jgi:DNA-binding Lrp family transcriptional regulator
MSEKETESKPLKKIELKLLAELMRNCRRSDRQLAKALGISQPTVGRLLSKMRKSGLIREYVALPDFEKLGYRIMALTFMKLQSALKPEDLEKARKTAKEDIKSGPLGVIMCERGIGLGFHGVVISYHTDYSSYREVLQWLKNYDFLDLASIESFLIDLEDKVHYRSLTFQTLAQHIMKLREEGKP